MSDIAAPRLTLRLPPDVREWVRRRAAENLRSENNEIVLAIRKQMAAETERAS